MRRNCHGADAFPAGAAIASRALPEGDLQISGSATPEEAAAIAVAIDLFAGDTAPVQEAPAPKVSPWFHAGLLEATGNDPDTAPFSSQSS